MLTLKLQETSYPDGAYHWEARDRSGEFEARQSGYVHDIPTEYIEGDPNPDDPEYVSWPDDIPRHANFSGAIAETLTHWFADVRKVSVLCRFGPGEARNVGSPTGPYNWLANDIEHYAWLGNAVKITRTLLCVSFVDDVRYMLVERAWLLGPDGSTIDKIAP